MARIVLVLALVAVGCGSPSGNDGGSGGGAGGSGGGSGGGGGADAGSQLETTHGGKPLSTWMKNHWAWTLSGANPDAGRDGDVVYLPLPTAASLDGGVVLTGSIAVTLAAADGFALPLYSYYGETYLPDSGTPDDPTNYPPDSDYTGSAMQVTVTLDGQKILDSASDSLTPWFFPAQTFNAPILYSAPTSYGSIGAIWVKGIGILHKPLNRGTHVLRVNELNTIHNFGFDNTWNVTVP